VTKPTNIYSYGAKPNYNFTFNEKSIVINENPYLIPAFNNLKNNDRCIKRYAVILSFMTIQEQELFLFAFQDNQRSAKPDEKRCCIR
jgi:hypothetical protein